MLFRSNNNGLIINSSYHPFISFILCLFSYSTSYSSQYTTSYNCAFFMMLVWSYHQWFEYWFVTLLMWEWTHCSPWYALRYHYNYRIGKWAHVQRKVFHLFPRHTQRWVDIVITINNFRTLVDFVIVDSIRLDLV
jgi:hypothetical protein